MSATQEHTTKSESELPVGVRRYDFRIARKLSQPQRIRMGALHSRMAGQLARQLESFLHCEVGASFLGLDQVQVANLPSPDKSSHLTAEVRLRPVPGSIYIKWPRDMAFFIIEKLLGGSGEEIFTDKSFSEFEKDIVKRFMNIIFGSLQAVFDQGRQPEGECEKIIEDQDPFANLLPYEILLMGNLNLRIKERDTKLTMIYPYSILKPWLGESEAAEPSEVSGAAPAGQEFSEGLAKAPLHITLRLGPIALKVSDFSSLQAGDCLQFNHSARQPFDVLVEGKVKYRGHLGRLGKQLGVKIAEITGGDQILPEKTT